MDEKNRKYGCYLCRREISKVEAERMNDFNRAMEKVADDAVYNKYFNEIECVHCFGPDEVFFGEERGWEVVLCSRCIGLALAVDIEMEKE